MDKLIYIFGIFAILNLIAVTKKSRTFEICTKIFLMPTLFLSFPFVLNNPLLLAVCVFYTIGDALLLSSKFPFFVAGALSFVVGHIVYYFNLSSLINYDYLVFAIIAGAMFLLYNLKAIIIEKSWMKWAELIYILFIVVLFVFAFSSGSAIMAFGGFLFAFSDMLIVKSKNGLISDNAPLVMYTYILGNLALLFGQSLII